MASDASKDRNTPSYLLGLIWLGRSTSPLGHERRFKRKSRTSVLPPIPDIIAASHRLASCRSDPRRGVARRREHRQGAGGCARLQPNIAAPNKKPKLLATALFAELRERLPERECVAFVRRDNAASLRAHLKMGMKDVASFEHDGVAHAVLAFAAPRRA